MSESEKFAPRQSLGKDRVADAYMHFHAMGSYGAKPWPTHHIFDEKTRDMANILVAEIDGLRARPPVADDLREVVARAIAGCNADELVLAGDPVGNPVEYPQWMLCLPAADAAILAITTHSHASEGVEHG